MDSLRVGSWKDFSLGWWKALASAWFPTSAILKTWYCGSNFDLVYAIVHEKSRTDIRESWQSCQWQYFRSFDRGIVILSVFMAPDRVVLPASRNKLVTIIATLGWASCGPGTGLQAHPLKSQYRFGKKKFADELHKSYKKTSMANFTYLFWTLYFASRTKNKLKQLYFNGAMSMFFQQSLHLPKNKQPKWRLLWLRDPWDHVSWFPLPSLGPSPMENLMLKA